MLFKKDLTKQIREIIELCEEEEIRTLIKYKRDGYTIIISNDKENKIGETALHEETKKRGRKAKGE